MRIAHLINGQAVPGRDYFDSINPAKQQVLAQVAAGGQYSAAGTEQPCGCHQSEEFACVHAFTFALMASVSSSNSLFARRT